MTRLMRCLILAVAVSMGWVAAASAVPTLEFTIPFQITGTVSYVGGAAPLVGASIAVSSVTGTGTPSNSGVTATCELCTLSFFTGGLTSAIGPFWIFGGGGGITLKGGVNFPDAIPDIATGTTLLTGTWSPSPSVTAIGTMLKIAGGSFVDDKAPGLEAFYGVPAGSAWFGNLAMIFFSGAASPPAGFTSTSILFGTVTNAVGEPPVMALFGAMLIGLGIWGRKIRRRGQTGRVQNA